MSKDPKSGLKVVLAGASGLAGHAIKESLLMAPELRELKCLGRRSLGESHLKLKDQVVDFDRLVDFADELSGDALICALGTTRKQAGSHEAQYKVDYEYVRKLARLAAMKGTPRLFVISSQGASLNSPFFYFRMKAEMEKEILQYPYSQLFIYRPGLLLGDRKEKRLGEGLASVALRAVRPVLSGPLRKYRPIHVNDLAKKIRDDLLSDLIGKKILENEEILK